MVSFSLNESSGRDKGNLFLFGSFLLAIVTVIAAGFTTSASEEELITVLNPALSTEMAERVPLAPRAETLEGKTIYLVDLQWGGPKAAYSVFEEMEIWFSKNMPSVKVEVRRSKGGWMGDDPDLRKEIVANAGGAVIGIGG